MARPAWHAAEALMRATARVERDDGEEGWTARGTAFFVTCSTLLTCAHVVSSERVHRVVWHDGKQRRTALANVESRHPAIDPVPGLPYPLPDVAVLQIAQPLAEPPMVWLDDADPGDDLWAHGYTDEYREDCAVGHSVRFVTTGKAFVDDDGAEHVWRVANDRIGQA